MLLSMAIAAPADGDLTLEMIEVVDGALLYALDEESWREVRGHEAPLTLVAYVNDELAWSESVWRRGGRIELPPLERGDRVEVALIGFDGDWSVRSLNGDTAPLTVPVWTQALEVDAVAACSGLVRGSSACIAASREAVTPDFVDLVDECDRLLHADALVSECVVALAPLEVDPVPLLDACDVTFERDADELMCVALQPPLERFESCADLDCLAH